MLFNFGCAPLDALLSAFRSDIDDAGKEEAHASSIQLFVYVYCIVCLRSAEGAALLAPDGTAPKAA